MDTPTAWAHLPNAPHIDRVLAHVRAHPQARAAARDAAYDAAWGFAAALVAWDDAGLLLDMPADAVRLLASSGHQPALLMLPACIALSSTT